MTAAHLVEQFYRLLADRDRAGLRDILSPEVVVQYHAQPERFPWAGAFTGHDGFDTFLAAVGDHLEIVEAERLEPIATDSHVVVQTIGSWRLKRTGAIIRGAMCNIFRVEDEHIVRYEVYADTAAFHSAWVE
jgi:ketosteroid isomerase-like protein